jgi:hypothetical protein
MRTLFEIGDDLTALAELFEDLGGEVTEDEAGQALEAWFDQLGEERDRKIDGYCALIREFEERSDARELEAKRLMALAGTDANNAKRLKARLKAFFEAQGIKKLETPRFKVGIQANGGALPLIVPAGWESDPASAPEAFQRRIIELDKDAVREAIRNEEETHGASLGERGTHLRIK